MSGTRSVCLSLWKVDDTATALLMQRFYANLLGDAPGSPRRCPRPRHCAKQKPGCAACAARSADPDRGDVGRRRAKQRCQGPTPDELAAAIPAGDDNDRPYAPPTSGRRSCWSATRIELRSSPGWRSSWSFDPSRDRRRHQRGPVFCNSSAYIAHVSPMRLQCERQQGPS